ncbi:MAG TPA: stage V sporulation protein AD [Pseudogracilibacillus sp.]|nr:stage V sporulation protein AD [Pseudogracilibacillus sp.]
MQIGQSSWIFNQQPVILSTGVVGGPFEGRGKIRSYFDKIFDDIWLNEKSFEKAQRMLFEEACQIAIQKSGYTEDEINFFFGGDLINQITPTTFTAKTLELPYFGLFSACATSMEGLALAAFIINSGGAEHVLTGTASHNAATERQFRYPSEYGGQKPPTAQWTVTGAGCAVVSRTGNGPIVTKATIGKVVDMGMTDPFNMGGAMAPAAVDTTIQHLTDFQLTTDYYDIILTGDLGEIGLAATYDLLEEKGYEFDEGQIVDCGLSIYAEDQKIHAGASGTASSAVATYGYFLEQLKKGKYNKMLVVATGSLHSPLTVQQNESIPCIAHAVAIERSSTIT